MKKGANQLFKSHTKIFYKLFDEIFFHKNILFFRCGTFFCYICGARLPNQNPYSHFSLQGNECYQLLFEGADEFGDEEFIFLDDNFEEDFDLFDQ